MKATPYVSVVLADDHPIVRQGVKMLIGSEPNLRIMGEAGDGLTAVDLTEKLRPDILVVDIQMPGITGLEVVRQLRLRTPQTRAIIFSMYATDAYIIEAFQAGAWGYLLKGADASELIQAIHLVRSGRRYLCKALPERLHKKLGELFEGTDSAGEVPIAPYDTLTLREKQVLQLIVEGLSNKEAGERLFISSRTVEIHRANALRKLGLRSPADMVRYALSQGLLPPT